MSDIEISVVIPAYFEANNLELVLPRLTNTLKEMKIPYEVIIVDSMIPLDETENICKKNNVHYVNRKNGNEYGFAFITGIQIAKGKSIVIMDADGSHDPEKIKELYQFRNEYQIVIASRYLEKSSTEVSFYLTGMSLILNYIYKFVLGIDANDISNSYRLYNGEMLRGVTLTSRNFDILQEVLYKFIRKYNAKIKEIPLQFHKRKSGKSKRNYLVFIPNYIKTLIKLRFFN